MAKLGVNIDHVATVRQARRTFEPDPVWAAMLAQLGGADGITVHLREDRRHIQDRDLPLLRQTVTVELNLEMACTDEMVQIALDLRPDQVTLVPERRQEITTEGGLDVARTQVALADAVQRVQGEGIMVSLFLDPDCDPIDRAAKIGAQAVELHTGAYADAPRDRRAAELDRLTRAGQRVRHHGMRLHAGHGLTYRNVGPVASLEEMSDLNIGHSIVARSIMVGMQQAVREMKDLITAAARGH